MSDEITYSLHVHPGSLSEDCLVQTVPATKRTTASEVVDKVVSRLDLDNDLSYVLAELHNHKGEEMVLAHYDHPVQRMLLWPVQFQHTYKFILRQTDKDGTVLYHGAPTWHAKANEDLTQRDMARKGFLPPTEPAEEDYPDLCALSNLTQDKVLEVLKMRFLKDKIYTYTANMLISINPYKFLPIYNPKYMTIYQNRKKEELAPHIYAVADTAFAKMVESKRNQCIVITGKSGSGKTQATHFLVHHTLALCQKSYMTGVEHMLIGCGPVLEALGNAQTEHNNNSSRFGKFLRIYFYESGLLSGADIQTYLLEKSRLVHQEASERNFHIFYYLLCGASKEELEELHLNRDMLFEYVNQNNMMPHHDAASELDRLRQAMEVIGFFKAAQKNIFKLISAILLLGNITFRVKKGRDEALEMEDESYLESVSSLLSLDPALVKKCLLTRKAKAGAGERFVLDLKLNEAKATRDAMAKALYQCLFEWTVNSVNMALAQRTRDSKLRSQSQWIGLLDIFGFEDFVKNSFEQFCINYASEHLQHYCIKHTFQIEQEAYRQEGLTWKEVDYADNSGCLKLYEKKPMGLFYLIDENFPGANNQALLSNFNRAHNSNPNFESPVVKEDAFIIKHYAGRVKYRIKDFREKNHDQVRDDITTLLRTTKSSFVQEVISKSPAALFQWSKLRAVVRAMFAFKNAPHAAKDSRVRRTSWRYEDVDGKHVQAAFVHKKMMARLSHHRNSKPPPVSPYRYDGGSVYGKKKATPSRSKKKSNSISQQYQASMAALLSALEKAEPYFVRCIQPNNRKIPLKLDEKLVLHQLRCSGTLQTIKLEQSRYPERLTADLFLQHYRLLFPKDKRTLSLEEIKSYLLSLNLILETHFQVGKTQIFLRNLAFHVLQDELHKAVLQRVVYLQARIRGHIACKCYSQQREAAVKIQSFWRMVETQREIEEWHMAAIIIQDAWHLYRDRIAKDKLLTQLQAYCKGYLARRRFKVRKLLMAKVENGCARVIQRAWKNFKKRKELAAIVIQTRYRSYAARLVFKKLKKERDAALERKRLEELEQRKLEIPFIDSSEDEQDVHKSEPHSHHLQVVAEEDDSKAESAAEIINGSVHPHPPVAGVLPGSSSSLAEKEEETKSSVEDHAEITESLKVGTRKKTEHPQLDETFEKFSFQNHVDETPKPDDETPKTNDETHKANDVTLISDNITSKSNDTTPKSLDVITESNDVLPKSHDLTLKLDDVILEPDDVADESNKKNLVLPNLKFDVKDNQHTALNPDSPRQRASAFSESPVGTGSISVARRIDQPPQPKTNYSFPNFNILSKNHGSPSQSPTLPAAQSMGDFSKYRPNGTSKEGSKVGDIFLKAAFSHKADQEKTKSSDRRLHSDGGPSDDDAGDGIKLALKGTKEVKNTPEDALVIPRYQQKASEVLRLAKRSNSSASSKNHQGMTENGEFSFNDKSLSGLRGKDNRHRGKRDKDKRPAPILDLSPTSPNKYTVETTFAADNMDTTEVQLSPDGDIARLQKEWLAFQRVEHERQLRELNKRVTDPNTGPKKENKQERKIREEISTLRLKQMTVLKEKMDSFGIGIDSMPDIRSVSRRTSEKTDPGVPSPPISPKTPTSFTPSTPEKKEPVASVKINSFIRSSSMESITLKKKTEGSSKPRRQRSNSAIDLYIDMRAPASDPISRKANSLNAEAFAKRCMEEEKLESIKSSEGSMEKLEVEPDPATPQPDTKKGNAFMDTVRKKLWRSHRNQGRQHSPLTPKKSSESSLSISSSTLSMDKSANEDVEVNVKSTEAEQFSPKLLVSKAEELEVLVTFIKSKIAFFDGTNLVDQVFKSALNEFCTNVTAMHSFAMSSGKTNGLRYKDIVSNFRQVLEKNANHHSLDQYAAMMAVNGFRGYMNEFMNDVLPKHVVKEARAKKKKTKDDSVERKGHRFNPVQWGITQVCEFCGGTMWLMESGFMCKICKFACHKKCFNKLVTTCPGAPSSGKSKTKPKKLFGERLISLEADDSLVPVFVDKCISYMEANGIYQEGIYRRSAAATQNKQLAEALNKDIECQKTNFDDYSIHSVASCFKKFLRSLPEPLVPHDKYFEFLQASKLNNEREKITSLFSVLDSIPEHNHATLERIIFHLARVAQQEPTNRMSPSNLAIVFTPCFFSPPSHVSPVDAAEHVGTMTKGIELIIIEQVKKIRNTLEYISEIQNVESTTNERLKQIRQSLGKGNKKRIRPSFREGPRSPTQRRPLADRRASLDAVEEDSDLAKQAQKYEKKMATLRSRKESLTSRLPALKPQLSCDEQESIGSQGIENPYCVTNEYLRHLNKHRVSSLPPRRRPARYSSPIYAPQLVESPPTKEEARPERKVSTSKGKFKKLALLASISESDSFRRTSQLRNPIHRPHRKRGTNMTSSPPIAAKGFKLSKIQGTMV